jgi:mono/diheme cytochrome c family protein
MTGMNLFADRCARCHGIDGQGSVRMAKKLRIDPILLNLTREKIVQKSPEILRQSITDGHGKMPQHKHELNAMQIEALIQYIQFLQKTYAQAKK